jgi:hypothetical protein
VALEEPTTTKVDAAGRHGRFRGGPHPAAIVVRPRGHADEINGAGHRDGPTAAVIGDAMAPWLRALLYSIAVSCLLAAPVLAEPLLEGRVTDAKTGEPIAKALVSIREQHVEAQTDAAGRFTLTAREAGPAQLYVSTVGYGLLKRDVVVGDGVLLELRLGQEAIQRTEEVTVATSPFEHTETGAASEHVLDNNELKNLAGVVADDALRSVQSLPGVTTGDDYNAVFAVRGSGFSSMGFYIDGVFTTAPFHTIRDINDGFTLTILNGDLVDSVALLSSAAPAPYGDRTGAVLNVRTREASRDRVVTRASLGATGLSVTSEGPLGKGRKASWLLAGRKSYLDYLLHRLEDHPSFVLGWYDLQGKLAFDVSAAHQLSLLAVHGDATYERNEPGQTRNSLFNARAGTQIATLEWRWLLSPAAVVKTRAYLDRETGTRRNVQEEILGQSVSRHTGYRSDLSLALGARHHLDAGVFARRVGETSDERRFDARTNRFTTTNEYGRDTWQPSAYVQDTWTPRTGLSLTLGGRVDHQTATGETVWLPRAAVGLSLSAKTKVDAAAGGFGQLPDLHELFGPQGNPDLAAARSRHYVAGIEHLIGAKVRVRAEAYYEDKSGFWFAPGSEYRLVDGRIVRPVASALQNVLTGSSRGFEVLLQRRSANRLSGWVSYAWGHTRFHEDGTDLAFDGDYDQRHTVNAYGSYRLTNTWNVSTKYRYGSSQPIVGFYEERGDQVFFLSAQRNEVRVPVYSRWDVRANKAFFFKRWKMTLYAEVQNLLNRTHYRYADLDDVNLATGQVVIGSDTLFPILPALGISVEF